MLNTIHHSLLLSLTFILISCGGGGGGNSESPSTNACSKLGLSTRIINGSQCSEENSPVLALNIVSRNGTGSLCSGTAITKTHILTAAHCFLEQNVLSVFVEIDGQRIFGKKVSVHPDAKIDTINQTAVSDVAVLEMTETLNRPTVPLLLSQNLKDGDIFSIFGFGLDQNGNLGSLESGQMKVAEINSSHIIAAYDGEGSNTCNGDSGGPALYTLANSGRAAIVGITSSGTLNTCLAGDRSYFANLQTSSILGFIQSVAVGVEGI